MDEKLIKCEPLGSGIEIFVSDSHTFGTDAILLADFAECKSSDRAVDLGTGCGIIPFLWARNGVPKELYGIEIQKDAALLAEKSAHRNNIADKIHIINRDLRELSRDLPFGHFSLVTANPPYKAAGAGIKSREDAKIIARHEVAGTLSDFIAAASKLLQTHGRFCMCLRPERLADTICLMREAKLEPKRLRTVCKTPSDAPWLFLIEGKKCSKAGLTVMPSLFVHNPDGSVSSEMEKIYGSYRENGRKK